MRKQPIVSRPPVAVVAAIVACAALVVLLSGAAENAALWPLIGICSGITSLGLVLAIRGLGFEWFSAPVVYLSYLWLFHFPLAFFGALSSDILRNLPAHMFQWTLIPSWHRATLIALACAAAFTVGASISTGKHSYKLRSRRWTEDASLASLGVAEAVVGAALIVLSIVQGGGAQAFHTSYGELYGTVFSGVFAYGVLLFTFGIPIALAGVKTCHFRVLICAQGLCACLMLFLGARSAGLFGGLITVIVLGKRGVKIPRWVTVIAVVAVLWLSAVVGVARQGAVGENLAGATDASPLDALLEMGGSLHTVGLFETWVSSGDQLQLGGGYWLPLERAIGFVVPGFRSDLATDPRAASEVMLSRTSGLGGSVVAEAYYNFGPLAPLFVFVPLGWLMAYLDRSARSAVSTAWLVVVFYPLLLEVRNWFISVPAMIAIGAVPLVLLTFSKRRRKPRQIAVPNLRPERGSC